VGGDVGQRDAALAARQRMAGRDCGHDALADDRRALQALGHRRRADERDVRLPAAHTLDESVRTVFEQRQLDARMRRVEGR